MRRLFLVAFVLPFFVLEAAGSTEIPSLKGDNGNLNGNSVDSLEQNGTVPGMQDYGAVIRPTKGITHQKGEPGCVNYFMHVAMLTDKQAEIEKLKGEVEKLKMEKENKLEIGGLKKNDEELAERIKKLEEKLGKGGKSEEFSKTDVLVPVNETKQCECECSPYSNNTQGETIMIMGGLPNNDMIILSPNRSKWIVAQLKLPYTIGTGGAVYLNGEIYVFGGSYNPKALYKLDKTLKWIRLADMNIGREYITNSCLSWDGYIWVFGGNDMKSVERYDPKTDKWTRMPDMKYSRLRGAATLWHGRFFITGGKTNTTEYFDTVNGRWTQFPNTPNSLYGNSLVTYRGKIITMGGDGSNGDNVWELNPLGKNPTWRPLESMKYASRSFAGIVFEDEIYAIGGYEGSRNFDRVEIFDGEKWRQGPSLPYSLWGMSAIIIPQSLADRLIAYKPGK